METLNKPHQKEVSTSDVIALAKGRAAAGMPESSVEPTQTQFTIEDYVDTLEDLKRARRFLAKAYEKYAVFMNPDLDPGSMQEIDRATRAKVSAERPNWEDHFPKDDSPEEQERWQQYVMSFENASVQSSLLHLQKVSKRHEAIKSDPSLQGEIEQYSQEKLETMTRVAAFRCLEREEAAITGQLQVLNARAVAMGETEWHNKEEIESLKRNLLICQQAREELIATEADISELERRKNLDAKRQLEGGVLITEQMADVKRKNLPSLLRGEPLLLVGETGGAKTALARDIANNISLMTGGKSGEHEIISGFDEINVYQLMGKTELRTEAESDATFTEFIDGPIARAMKEGRPVILDEVNAMPAGLLKRLNIIMQVRPGDTYKLQENNGEEIIVQPGFCIIATMNEKSHRYKGVDKLSSEFKDRFGVNVSKIEYPDQDIEPGGESIPANLLQLATLECTNPQTGEIELKNMSLKELLSFVRAAHFSQALFTRSSADASAMSYVSSDRAAEASNGATALKESVISPRTMLQILRKVEKGNGSITIQEALADFLDRVEDAQDKAILSQLFLNYGLAEQKEG